MNSIHSYHGKFPMIFTDLSRERHGKCPVFKLIHLFLALHQLHQLLKFTRIFFRCGGSELGHGFA